jgi:hypothetical protein
VDLAPEELLEKHLLCFSVAVGVACRVSVLLVGGFGFGWLPSGGRSVRRLRLNFLHVSQLAHIQEEHSPKKAQIRRNKPSLMWDETETFMLETTKITPMKIRYYSTSNCTA